MNVPDDSQLLESGGFRLQSGARFLDARNSAANEIMRRHRAGEIKETWDNIFYFPHPADADLGESLIGSGRLPELGSGVPIASWILVRFRRIAPEYFPDQSAIVSDGGGYSFDFYVLRGEEPVGWLQLQGGMDGVLLLGEVKDTSLTEILSDLVLATLLDRPTEIAACTVEVIDLGWEIEPDYYQPTPSEESRNRYGWDGEQYLGAENIREVS
jgi:hypothetical protein